MKKLINNTHNAFLVNAIMVIVLASFLFASCSSGGSSSTTGTSGNTSTVTADTDPMKNKGVGPVKNVNVGATVDPAMASRGLSVFEAKCAACHQMDKRYVGPELGGITQRRTPEWIMNMILNPEEMTKKDPLAKKAYEEYLVQMVYQDVTEQETRAILEYFREYDAKIN